MRQQISHILGAGVRLLAILLCVGCGLTPPAVRRAQQVDGFTIAIELAGAPRVNDSQQVLVTLTDAAGVPVNTARVSLDLVMIEHPMGMNTPIASPQGNGRYAAEAIFTMAGPWQFDVIAVVDERPHRAHFVLDVP